MTTLYSGFDSDTYPGAKKMRSLLQNTCLKWCGYYLRQVRVASKEDEDGLPVEPLQADQVHWQGHYDEIRAMGWGVAPIYMGKSTHKGDDKVHYENAAFQKLRHNEIGFWTSRDFVHFLVGLSDQAQNKITENKTYDMMRKEDLSDNLYQNGYWDGREAAWLADANNIHAPTVIYFDMESQPEEGKVFFYFPQWMDYFRGWCASIQARGYTPGLYTNQHMARIAVEKLRQPSKYGVFPYIYIWCARYDYGEGEDFKATGDGVYKVTKSGLSQVLANPASLTYQKITIEATSWQYAGNSYMTWQDNNVWQPAIKCDPCTSIFADPGHPW